ncbi:hypothetical protein SAY86_027041 [Trapa natans]|uniref:Heat shock 70 kDa protein 17 n=1 Tax=Trapa natans TaxID=22666 RepID=A0AAN7KSY4_TRANT|nr:hypothetical protein SAY86_027041 [Trapa natans]
MRLGLPLVGIFLLVLLLIIVPSQSAVSSVDLGSEWVKVAVVNIKKGQSPITIAINEMSKRKSPALVAFQADARLLGEEAAGLVARYPDKVYSQIRDLIGKPYGYAKRFLDSLYLPFDVVEDSRETVTFRVDDSGNLYSAEELFSMILKFAANLAEFHSKVPIKDVVISVPPYYGQAERRGLLQAAQLAGINVLSLINEHSGAALQYGIDKDFSNESRHVLFYDMGSSSTYAALVYFSAYSAKEFGKTTTINQFQVKDVRWNSQLGGQDMELRLVEHFADEFNKQVGNGIDVRKSPKAMAKLKKQVKRTKEILSANKAAPISVESLYDDRDFRSTITREKFEELCADLWEKALLPVKEVLENSDIKVDEIYAVELIGGATRVPKLQVTMQEFFGKKELDRHLDADEAIVLGSALHAANLSDGIRLNRKLGMVDGSSYGFMVELNGPGLIKDESTRQLLVPRMKKLPSKMYRSIVHNKDFEVSLEYESEELLPSGVSSPVFAQYAVLGLSDAADKHSSKNLSSPIKANLHFSLSRSGILSLDRADAVVEFWEWVEVPRKNLTVENLTTSSPDVSLEANTTTEESTDKATVDNETSSTVNTSMEEKSSEDLIPEKKLKRRVFRVPLKITEKTTGPGKSLSKEYFVEAKTKLETLDKKDAERRRTAELKNNLESYIYATKEQLEMSEDISKITTSDERQSFIEKMDAVQDWLYTEGEDATASEFQERLSSLKAVGDPISFRLKELTARPAATEYARSYLNEIKEIVKNWETKKSWIPREKIVEVLDSADKLKTWLTEKESEQKKAGFTAPAFTSDEVYNKVFSLQDQVASVNRIPKPKPKIEKPAKNETKDDTKSSPEESSQNDQTGKDGDAADETKPDTLPEHEAEVHDEL